MKLRPELEFPELDEAKVQLLAELARCIDGAHPGYWEEELAEFNKLAGTSFEFLDFQGIYGGMEHESWVRNVLSEPYATRTLDLTDEETLEIITRLCTGRSEEYELFFWIKLLEHNVDPRISDLLYWPGEYFGDGNDSRELSPQKILEIAKKSTH